MDVPHQSLPNTPSLTFAFPCPPPPLNPPTPPFSLCQKKNGSSNWEVKGPAGYPPIKSPYATDYPEAYKKTLPRALEDKGMRHFEGNPHLARTTAERQEGGIGPVIHLLSGYDQAQRPTGRLPVQAAKHDDPKDGGIWEPVKRVYPSVPRVDYGNGVRICDRPKVAKRLVDIWPATITVRDDFKPGGTKQFEGKRNTDKNAFPSAIGYSPPKNYDENGRRIDYSSVEQGGPFGVKMLHSNSPVPLPDAYQDRYLPDKTSKSKTLGELGELNKTRAYELSGPQTGKHGSVFPFRPASSGRRGRGARPHSSQAQTGGSKVEPALSLQATRSTAAIPAAAPHASPSHSNSQHSAPPILHHPLHPQPSLPVPPRPRRDPSQQVIFRERNSARA